MVLRDRVYYVKALTSALVLSLIVGFSGCKKKEVAEEAPEEAPAATPTPKPAPAPKIAEATPPPKAAAPAPTPQFAPPGVYFLITAVSVETSDGILGLKPGQMLKEVKPGVYKADNNEVTLRPDQVTNDLTIARRVAAVDQQTQAAIQQRLAASASAPSHSATSNPSGPAPAAANAPSAEPSVRQELIKRRDALVTEASQVGASLNQSSGRYGGNWELASKRSPQVFGLLQQYNGLQRQITDLNNQISQAH